MRKKMHGWYRAGLDDRAKVWRQPSGREVVVTDVTADRDGVTIRAEDATYVGPVVEYVRDAEDRDPRPEPPVREDETEESSRDDLGGFAEDEDGDLVWDEDDEED